MKTSQAQILSAHIWLAAAYAGSESGRVYCLAFGGIFIVLAIVIGYVEYCDKTKGVPRTESTNNEPL